MAAPISAQLELTGQCTNNCIHCYNHFRVPGEKVRTLNKAQLAVIVEQLVKNSIFSVTLTGGEPLICKDVLLEVIESLQKANIDLSLNSNLTLLNREYAQELKSLGIRSILVSLLSYQEDVHDQITETQGSFGKTIKGIRAAVESGIRISVNMVINQRNFTDIYGLFAIYSMSSHLIMSPKYALI